MKYLSLIFNAILGVAVVVLFILVLNTKHDTIQNQLRIGKNSVVTGKLPIAYVNIDTLLQNYHFAKSANESLTKKQEDSRLALNIRARELQTEMADFQRKLENQVFLSRERAEQERVRLEKKQQELQELDGKLTQQLVQLQQKMSEQLRDTINKFMKEYNKDNKYELIISNTSNDNVLYAKQGYNITKEVVKLLNERCKVKD